MRKANRRRSALAAACLAVLLADPCLGGQQAKPAPGGLPPLTREWRERLYGALTARTSQRGKDNTKYFFAGTPIPCVVKVEKNVFFVARTTEQPGYGILILIKSRGLLGVSDNLCFCLLDGEAKVLRKSFANEFNDLTVEPEFFAVSRQRLGGQNSYVLRIKPKISDPAALIQAAAFKKTPKELFDTLPPYNQESTLRLDLFGPPPESFFEMEAESAPQR